LATILRGPADLFGSGALGAQRHICAFYNSPDEQYRTLLPFIKDGFVPPDQFLRELREERGA